MSELIRIFDICNKGPILFAFLVMFLPALAFANEPLVQMIYLFWGAATWGGFLFKSLLGFAAIVVIKSIVFIWKSDVKSVLAVLYVFIANLLSTMIGTIAGLLVANLGTSLLTIIGFFIFVAILYWIFLRPAKRLAKYKKFSKLPPPVIAINLIIITIFATLLMAFSADLLGAGVLALGWVVKVIAVTIAIALSLIISVVYEEAVISALHKLFKKETKSFMEPVIWCNVIAFALVMLVGAGIALPKRLASPDFLLRRK